MGRNAPAIRQGNAALGSLKRTLQTLPTTMAVDIASRAGPALTDLTRDANASRRGVYGEAYPIGVDGQQLTLHRTGAVAGSLEFRATGTIVRARLPEKYARYLIGKYNILPNGALPAGWRTKLDALVKETKVSL